MKVIEYIVYSVVMVIGVALSVVLKIELPEQGMWASPAFFTLMFIVVMAIAESDRRS